MHYSFWRPSNSEELYHFGILGMKWGVRRFQKKDGSLTKAGKEHRKELKGLRKEGDDYVLEKGSNAYRIAGANESYDDHKRKYMSITDEDRDVYQELVYGMGGLIAQTERHYGEYINVTTKDVLIKNGEHVVQDIIDKYGDDTLKESLARVLAVRQEYKTKEERDAYYNEFINWTDDHEMERDLKRSRDESAKSDVADKVWDVMEKHSDEILSKYKKAGYDAIIDPYDFINNASEMPIIVLDPSESIRNEKYIPHPGDHDWDRLR